MKLKDIKLIIVICICMLFIVAFPNVSLAGTQELNNLDFEVYLTEDGNMKVTETWDVYIYETNTLFKTFPIDDSHNGITDVTVSRIDNNGNTVRYSKVNKYEYHVDEEHYQALVNPDGNFEIAWGVNETSSSTRTYKISYTVQNNVTVYNDCAELYWQFIGDEFGINADNVTGKIYLPTEVQNIEDLRVWAHGPLNGTINRENGKAVVFDVNNLNSGTFLEIRLTTPTEVFGNSTNKVNENQLETIISEETVWAEEANKKREEIARRDAIIALIFNVVEIVAIILVLVKIIKDSKKLSNTPKQKPEQEYEFFRDFPDENASAAEAGYLYYYSYGTIYSSAVGKLISGTMLNLSLKGWISFEQNNKKTVTVYINESGNKDLTEDEKLIYDFLKKVSDIDRKFTMKEFEKYCTSNNSEFLTMYEMIKNIPNQTMKNKGKFDDKQKKRHDSIVLSLVLESSIIGLLFVFGIICGNPLISIVLAIITVIDVIILSIVSSRITGLTQKGIDEKEQWTALKRYMENFSMLDEKEVPDLILWEKYLVYATTFGIADKVIKQLKVKYPELQDEEYMRNNFAYMHIACNSNNNFNFINTIDSSIGNATNYSSGNGSGGGFSGGGGGRRTAEAVVEAVKKAIKY